MTSGAPQRLPERLALLVGSNPLPNYLAATVLRPREVVLLYSPETIEPYDRLRCALAASHSKPQIVPICIDDATDARRIVDACRALQVDHLHYSGGTKPMAAHARATFKLHESQASYLDERKGLLRFDDGYDIRLSDQDLGLTLDLVLALHGAERVRPTPEPNGGPSDGDVVAISCRVLEEPTLAKKAYDRLRPRGRRRSFTDAKGVPWKPADECIALSATLIPDSDWTRTQYEAWDDFVTGTWLERWTASAVRSCIAESAVEIGVCCERAKPPSTEFEIDVALIRGHRLYVVSCTTEHEKKALCKSKLFEVAMRARQMGGDLARSALVCLLDGSNDKGAYVDQLRSDIAGVWDAPNVPRVFGLADLREWAGTSGTANVGSLKEWLDS